MKTKWCLAALAALVLMLPPETKAAGACTSARFHDWNDMGCNQNYASAGAPSPGGCPPCTKGMPRWWVSEPYINLCMADTPLSYKLSSGQEMEFSFYYRQRAKLPATDEVSALPIMNNLADVYPTAINCGTNASWGNNWNISITVWDPTWESFWTRFNNTLRPPTYAPYSQGYQVFVWRPEGGINYFNVQIGQQNVYDPQSLMRLVSVTSGQNYPVVTTKVSSSQLNNPPVPDDNGIYWGIPGVGLKLVYPDGSQDVFGLTPFHINFCDQSIFTFNPAGSSVSRLLLTQRIDPQGRTTQLGYEHMTNMSPYGAYYYRLRHVVDPDGRTNTFNYSSGLQISEISDPYNRKAKLTHTTLNGRAALSSIVDAAGLTNTFSYQGQTANGWITSLTTPYGTTRFNYYFVAEDSSVTNGYRKRAIYVSEPAGAGQLYLYQHENPNFVSSTETSPTVPGQSFDDGTTGGSGHPALTYRNTFHWGRRQFDALPYYYVREYLGMAQTYPASSDYYFSQALSALSTADYTKAELKHWLLSSGDSLSITEGMSSQRDPSPDPAGTTPGLRTWYNYVGQPSVDMLGSDPKVTCIARLLPDGSSQYTLYNYNAVTGIPGFPAGAGFVSSTKSSYSKPDGSLGVLTNSFCYAANSVDLISVSNSAGQYVQYGYNGSHQITTVTNSLNQVTRLNWDDGGGTHNLTGIQFPSGQSLAINLNYDGDWDTNYNFVPGPKYGFADSMAFSPQGRSFTINSYSAGLPASVTDDRNLTITNTWDGLNRLTSTSFPDNTTISNRYYRLDLVGTKDRLGNWTRYAFDGLQHLTTVTNANNAVTTYSWCGCGSLESIVDALTNLTAFHYDNQGNLTNVVYPDYSSITWQFDLAGRMTNAFDGAGRTLRLAYNNQGLPTNIASANGVLESIVYDALNRPVSITDANGVTVTNQFDNLNRLLKRTWISDGISEGFGYSAAGLTAYTNRNQQVTRYGRDAAGRLTAVTNANLEVTQFGYDSLNNVTSLIDGLQHQTAWQYNQYGWLTNKMDGLNRTAFRYAYNANGWVTNRWTPEKGNTGYTFDNVGNLTAILYPLSSILYSYDPLNRLTNMVDAVGTHNFTYTAAGQLASESNAWTTVSYTYQQRLRTAMSIGTNWTQTYGYDSGWRMTNTVSPAGAFGYSYNVGQSVSAASLVRNISLPNGANIVNNYDSLARLTGTALNNYWGHTLDGYGYTPDALGLRTNIVRNLGLTSSTVTAGFDNIGQLTSWSATEAGGTSRQNEQLGFGYDAAHNLHTRNNGSLAQTFTTDAANQLNSVTRSGNFTFTGATPAPATNVTVNGLQAETYGDFTFARTNLTLADGNNTFTVIATNVYGVKATNILTVNLPQSVTLGFDNNGNLTNDGTKTFAFDAENQLTNVTVAGKFKKEFAYDGLNRLRIKREFGWTGSTWNQTNEVHFIWDGTAIVQHRDSNDVPTLTLTRGLDLSGTLDEAGGIGGLLAMTVAGGTNYFYHADALGNITALMDAQENIVARREYDAFGRTISLGGSKAGVNPYWYSSQLFDEDTRLAHFAYREYAPDLMRFITPDPIQERGGINLYRFVGNNPANRVDPLGLQLLEIPPIFFEPPPVVPPAEIVAPRPVGIPLPRVPGASYPKEGPFPPSGTVENPFRPGSFGRYVPNPKDPANPKFQECWRFDKGDPNLPGWRGLDHFHHWGDETHMQNPPPFQWFSAPPVMNNNVNTPSIYPTPPTSSPPPPVHIPIKFHGAPPEWA